MAVKKADIKKFFLQTMVGDVMASPVITVKEDDDFALVQEKFTLYDVRHLPVLNNAGEVVGLITQRDLFQIHSPRRLESGGWYYDTESLNQFLLSKVMLRDPLTMKAGHALFEAVDAMLRFKFGCIPIVDEYNVPCGILTRETILKFLIA
jgi:acetoin utilization protein AcuB